MKALYARQSLDKKDSLSIENQIELCKSRLYGGEAYKEYTDKGFSGKDTDRPALNDLMKDIEQNKIDGVIVYKLDRFSRNIVDFFRLYNIMKEHNCNFCSVVESFDTDSSLGEALLGILVVFADMERKNIQRRVKDNYYYRISQDGRWAGGTPPYGFKNARTEDRKPTLIVDEEQMEAVKLIFDLYSKEISISLGKIAKILRERGYKSGRSGKSAWDSSSISKILQNTVYVKADDILYRYLELRQIKFLNDKSMWNGEHSAHIVGKRVGNANIRKYTDLKDQSVYITNFSGVIDSRTYIQVMKRLGNNEQLSNTTKGSVLQELGGKLKCECGYAIKSYSKSTNGRPYIDCYANRTLHICQHKYNKFNFYEIQEEVGIQIQEKMDSLREIMEKRHRERQKRVEEVRRLKDQLSNLVKMASMSKELEQATMREIESVQRMINYKEFQIQLKDDLRDDFDNLEGVYETDKDLSRIKYKNLSMEEKKYIVNLLIDRIILYEDQEEISIMWKV